MEAVIDDAALYKKDCQNDISLWSVSSLTGAEKVMHNFADKIYLLGYERSANVINYGEYAKINYSFMWMVPRVTDIDYHLEISVTDGEEKKIWEKIYPLAYGMYPTSKWGEKEKIETDYWFLLPEKYLKNDYEIVLNLVDIKKGYAGLNGIRSAKNFIEKKENLGDGLKIND